MDIYQNFDEVKDFLEGSKLTNGLYLKITSPEKSILGRLSYLEKISKNKNIIHLGCCGHVEYIMEKINRNKYLHQILTTSANK